jgi:hypothetical protein
MIFSEYFATSKSLFYITTELKSKSGKLTSINAIIKSIDHSQSLSIFATMPFTAIFLSELLLRFFFFKKFKYLLIENGNSSLLMPGHNS